MGFVKRLFILRDEMGGGSVWAIEIGYHMLYVVGSLGLSIVAGLKLLDFVDEWMLLKMPTYSGSEEIRWVQIHHAHCLPTGLSFDTKDPFRFLLSISQSELVRSLFPNQNRLVNNLLMANLPAKAKYINIVLWQIICRQVATNADDRMSMAFKCFPYLLNISKLSITIFGVGTLGRPRFLFHSRTGSTKPLYNNASKCLVIFCANSFAVNNHLVVGRGGGQYYGTVRTCYSATAVSGNDNRFTKIPLAFR